MVDPTRVNVELGGDEGWRRLCTALGEAGLGQVLDIVPNHMSIAGPENSWWWDLLENGRASRYALYFDVSWDEVAKYIVASPESIKAVADLVNRYPDRFLFGTDEVAPSNQTAYLKVYSQYAPLFAQLTPEASEKLRKKNYERLFDEARRKVRAWEKANVKETGR